MSSARSKYLLFFILFLNFPYLAHSQQRKSASTSCLKALSAFFLQSNEGSELARVSPLQIRYGIGSPDDFGIYVFPRQVGTDPLFRTVNPFDDVSRFVGSPYLEKNENFLFLSEGPLHSSVGAKIAENMPHKRITISDISYPKLQSSHDNLLTVYVDNNDTLPFLDNEFGIILQRKGLCACSRRNSKATCGGIPLDVSLMGSYFEEIFRILDKRQENSFALLQGSLHTGFNYDILDVIMLASQSTMKKNPDMQIDLIYEAQKGSSLVAEETFFWGLKISRRNN